MTGFRTLLEWVSPSGVVGYIGSTDKLQFLYLWLVRWPSVSWHRMWPDHHKLVTISSSTGVLSSRQSWLGINVLALHTAWRRARYRLPMRTAIDFGSGTCGLLRCQHKS